VLQTQQHTNYFLDSSDISAADFVGQLFGHFHHQIQGLLLTFADC